MNIQAEINALDTKIAEAKTYLKKLRQYKRLLAKIQAEKEAIAQANTVQLDLDLFSTPSDVTVEIEEVAPSITENKTEATESFWQFVIPDEPDEKEVIAAVEETPAPTNVNVIEFSDYQSMGIRALRLLCRDRGIKGAARMSKSQCLEALAA